MAGLALTCTLFCSCNEESDIYDKSDYSGWKDTNQAWLNEQLNRVDANGRPYFSKIVPVWNPAAYVLIHYFNNTDETAGNLVPLLTSTVDVRYRVALCDGTPVDSSSNVVTPVPGALRVQLSDLGLISGWKIALTHMHVGDTCEVVIPYLQAYGESGYGTIKPYSNLQFNLRLVDIPYYEVRP